MRKLALDATTLNKDFLSTKLAGFELESGFIDLGKQLFNDGDSACGLNFQEINMLADSTAALHLYKNSFNIVYEGSVIHLFDQDQIKVFCERVFDILKSGGTFIGRHCGVTDISSTVKRTNSTERLRFLHTAETMKELLESLGYIEVIVESTNVDMPSKSMSSINVERGPMVMLMFSAKRA